MNEIEALEACVTECRKRLENYRNENDELQIDLTEADLNAMLERLGELYRDQPTTKVAIP